jgi:mono/diheme cytochrome c family protein
MIRHSAWPEVRILCSLLRVAPAFAVTAFTCLVTALSSTPDARAADTPAYPQGAAAFQSNCAMCHGPAGAGVPALAPPLLSEPARFAASAEGRRQLAITLLYGMFGDITVGQSHFNSQMPDFARLDDATLAATLNFVVFDLAHAATAIKPLASEDIAAERAHPLDGAAVRAHRKSLVAGGA